MIAVSNIHGSLRLCYCYCVVGYRNTVGFGSMLQALLLPSGESAEVSFWSILLAAPHSRAAPFSLCHVCIFIFHSYD